MVDFYPMCELMYFSFKFLQHTIAHMHSTITIIYIIVIMCG